MPPLTPRTTRLCINVANIELNHHKTKQGDKDTITQTIDKRIYTMSITDWPIAERPREKLLQPMVAVELKMFPPEL